MQISVDDPLRDDVLLLLEEHLADMRATSPPESVHALDPSELVGPGLTFWTLREDGVLLGCAALKEIDAGHAEIKSMRTAAAARRRGVAGCFSTTSSTSLASAATEAEPGDRHPGLLRAGPCAVRVPRVRRVRAVRVLRPGSAQRVLLKDPQMTPRSSNSPPMRSLRVASVATLLTLSTLLAGCGGDDDKDSKSDDKVTETITASENPTTEATEATETTASTDAPMDPTDTGDITQEQVEAALLTPEEVGADFALGAYTDEDTPPLCDPDGTPLDVALPPQVQGGAQFDHSSGDIAMQEEIAVYATEAEAAEAFGLATAGLACSEGTSDGSPITIGAPQDVTAEVNAASGIGTSTAWEVSGDGFKGVIVATLAGRIIMATQFASATDADTSGLPSPVDVATAAFAKALAN